MNNIYAIISVLNEAFSNSDVRSFFISVGAGMALDGTKRMGGIIGKYLPSRKKMDPLSYQVIAALQDTLESFYSHMQFEYSADLVLNAFYEEYCNHKEMANEFGFRVILELAFNTTLTDEDYKLWISIFFDNACKYNILIMRLLMHESVEKNAFTERDLVYERLLIKNQKHINDDYIGNEFYYRLETIFEKVDNLFSCSWKNDILQIISKLSYPEANREIVNRKLEFIRSNEECDEVFEQIKVLLELYDYRASSYNVISQIKDFIKHPHYNKVLIVTGTSGSGKTYFVSRYIKHCISAYDVPNHTVMPLWLNMNDNTSTTVSSYILNSLGEVAGCSLSTPDIAADFVSGMEIKICFIIENIHIFITDTTSRYEIFKSIKEFSKYDCFCWLLTIDEYEYYCLNDETDFLRRYCISKLSALNTEEQNDSLFEYALSINALNEKNMVVKSILCDRYHISADFSVLDIVGGITTPREAEIYGQCVGKNTILALPSSYKEFIDTIVALKAQEIAKYNNQSVLNTVIKIIDYVIDNHDCTIKGYNSEDANISILRKTQLLSPTITENNDTFSIDQGFQVLSLRLQFLPYWASKMVGARMSADRTESIQILGYPEELQEWLIPCFIFCNSEGEKGIDFIFPYLRDEQILEYALFCTRRDINSSKFGKSLFEYLIGNLDYFNNAKRSYAILYFVYNCRLRMDEKFRLLIGVAEQIEKNQLTDIYHQVFKSIVKTAGKLKNFKKNILELTRCTCEDINYINGYCAADVLMKLAVSENKSFDILLGEIVYFIEKHKLKDTIQSKNKCSFLDFLLRGCYERYLLTTHRTLTMIYDDYTEWFNREAPIGAYIKRNLTCAAGNIFSLKKRNKDNYYYQYIDLVTAYSKKNYFYEKATAWFLIRNSVTELEPDLDPRLCEILYYLLKNHKIRSLYEKEGRPFG